MEFRLRATIQVAHVLKLSKCNNNVVNDKNVLNTIGKGIFITIRQGMKYEFSCYLIRSYLNTLISYYVDFPFMAHSKSSYFIDLVFMVDSKNSSESLH